MNIYYPEVTFKFFNNTTHEIGHSANNNTLNTDSVGYQILSHKQFLVDIIARSFCSTVMTNLLCQHFRVERFETLIKL